MGTSKLALYNASLFEIGERKLASLTEEREPRRVLDDVYERVLLECLSMAQWKFARRAAEIEYDAAVEPAFGYERAFEIPSDMLRLCGLASDGRFENTLMYYSEEAGYWYADVDVLYAQYVSSGTDYGMDLSLWTPKFIRFVELSLAERICLRLTQSDTKLERIQIDLKKARIDAEAIDAMGGPQKIEPPGQWASARFGGGMWSRRREQG